jgi:asparagine N-glycosylation enzyme membrane subunit Stt3
LKAIPKPLIFLLFLIMGLRYRRKMAVLLAILLVALALRPTTFKYPYLMAYDPFHHYKIAEYTVENRGSSFFWELSLAPRGTWIFEPMGLYYVSATNNTAEVARKTGAKGLYSTRS